MEDTSKKCEKCNQGVYLTQKTEDLLYTITLADGSASTRKTYYKCDRCGDEKEVFEPQEKELEKTLETEQNDESGKSRISTDQSDSRRLEEKRIAYSKRFERGTKKLL